MVNVLTTDAHAELLTERRERSRVSIQTGGAAIAVLVVVGIAAIVDWSTVWPLAKYLTGYWCSFYVLRSMLAWHRIEKAGRRS